jgi:site-specific recombinase XerC
MSFPSQLQKGSTDAGEIVAGHLALREPPARAIQELAGHQDLATTQRYMHLSPASLDAATRLLDE